MTRKTGGVRSEICSLRHYFALISGSTNSHWGMLPQMSDRPQNPPRQSQPVNSPLLSGTRYDRISPREWRIRPGQILWVMTGIGLGGVIAMGFWQSQVPDPISPKSGSQELPARQSIQGRSPIVNQTQVNQTQPLAPIDMDKVEELEHIPAPSQKIVQAVQFYLDAGLTPTATAYLVGSLSWESGLDPNAVGDRGQSKGLNQWWASRRKGLPDSFEGQLVYVLQDMQQDTLSSSTLKTLRTSHNPATIKAALKRWTRWQQVGDRWDYAETILEVMNPVPGRAGA